MTARENAEYYANRGDYYKAYEFLKGEAEQRVGDATRSDYVEHLSDMMAKGYLKNEEFNERKDAALEAETLNDLKQTIKGLPPLPSKAPATRKVTLNVNDQPFSVWKWWACVTACVAGAVVPSTVLASMCGGFGHTPLNGGMAVMFIIGGVLAALGFGVTLAPSGNHTEVPAE